MMAMLTSLAVGLVVGLGIVWVLSEMRSRQARNRIRCDAIAAFDRQTEEIAAARATGKCYTPSPYRSCNMCGREWYGKSPVCPKCGDRHSGIEEEPGEG